MDADAIEGVELAAVQRALDGALTADTLYPTLALMVFPFVDRASHLVEASGDTTRLVGIELDIDVQTDSGRLDAEFTVLLAWTDYRATTRTVDTVFFVTGAGQPPMDDSLKASFSPDTVGSGTALIVYQAVDSSVTVWQTGTGRFRTTASRYGSGRTQSGGGLTLTVARGTIQGFFQAATAYRRPDSATVVAAGKDFTTGARALRVVIRGTL